MCGRYGTFPNLHQTRIICNFNLSDHNRCGYFPGAKIGIYAFKIIGARFTLASPYHLSPQSHPSSLPSPYLVPFYTQGEGKEKVGRRGDFSTTDVRDCPFSAMSVPFSMPLFLGILALIASDEEQRLSSFSHGRDTLVSMSGAMPMPSLNVFPSGKRKGGRVASLNSKP